MNRPIKSEVARTRCPLHLIPPVANILEATVLEHGRQIYGDLNWRISPSPLVDYIDACMRHLLCWLDGQDNDVHTGLSHLAHARANLGIALDVASLAEQRLFQSPEFMGEARNALDKVEEILIAWEETKRQTED